MPTARVHGFKSAEQVKQFIADLPSKVTGEADGTTAVLTSDDPAALTNAAKAAYRLKHPTQAKSAEPMAERTFKFEDRVTAQKFATKVRSVSDGVRVGAVTATSVEVEYPKADESMVIRMWDTVSNV